MRTVAAGGQGHADPSVTLTVLSPMRLKQRDRQAAELLGSAVLGAKPHQQLGTSDNPASTKFSPHGRPPRRDRSQPKSFEMRESRWCLTACWPVSTRKAVGWRQCAGRQAHGMPAGRHIADVARQGTVGPSVHQPTRSCVHLLGRAVKCCLIATNPEERATAPGTCTCNSHRSSLADARRFITAEADADGVVATAIALSSGGRLLRFVAHAYTAPSPPPPDGVSLGPAGRSLRTLS